MYYLINKYIHIIHIYICIYILNIDLCVYIYMLRAAGPLGLSFVDFARHLKILLHTGGLFRTSESSSSQDEDPAIRGAM